jgi:hypothetical protein
MAAYSNPSQGIAGEGVEVGGMFAPWQKSACVQQRSQEMARPAVYHPRLTHAAKVLLERCCTWQVYTTLLPNLAGSGHSLYRPPGPLATAAG